MTHILRVFKICSEKNFPEFEWIEKLEDKPKPYLSDHQIFNFKIINILAVLLNRVVGKIL